MKRVEDVLGEKSALVRISEYLWLLLTKLIKQINSILFAISLIESIRSYERTCEKGVSLVWESYKLDPYVQRLAENVFNFQEKNRLTLMFAQLKLCAYSTNVFADILNKIQKAVDDLSLHQYSNLHLWVNKLDEEVEKKLALRLEAGIKAWTKALEGKSQQEADLATDTDTTTAHKLGGDPQIQTLIHEIRITNQVIYVNPSVEEARFNIMQQLFAWENVVLLQTRIQSSRYQIVQFLNLTRNLLRKMPDGAITLEAAYQEIENKIKQMDSYVKRMARYQALWDLQPEALYSKLGENINLWMNTLIEIKKSRTTFDTTEVRKEIGPVIIEYAKSRSDLEQQSIETDSTSDAVTFITYVQSLKKKMKIWDKKVELYREGQRILERQRFQFPNSWLHIDNVEGEWSAFNEIIRRKDSAIQVQVASLQVKIVAEDKAVEARTNDVLNEWEKAKPVEVNLHFI
ncbi:dynein heavy chain, cytoplasmic [Caerostris extrusa]|uniref:Dynein heavy chain, cytoplasmic n=1 Tax=Caerostris extrusa TaxID=172846 RepID=A0AAV4MXQ3_CAEEX|nr:dynein heavy chain, cytoplasmic [Caerostris extrusa]